VKEFKGGQKQVLLSAIYGHEGENKDFTDATPSGAIEITVGAGKPAADHFKPGRKYYVSFDEVADEVK
jgi:hypothetical protein